MNASDTVDSVMTVIIATGTAFGVIGNPIVFPKTAMSPKRKACPKIPVHRSGRLI